MADPVEIRWMPNRKVGLGAFTLGVPLAVIVAWVLREYGIVMPGEVQAALGAVISSVLAYLVPEKKW